jgi:hypothetical protein
MHFDLRALGLAGGHWGNHRISILFPIFSIRIRYSSQFSIPELRITQTTLNNTTKKIVDCAELS